MKRGREGRSHVETRFSQRPEAAVTDDVRVKCRSEFEGLTTKRSGGLRVMVAEYPIRSKLLSKAADDSRPSGGYRRSVDVQLSTSEGRIGGRLHLDVVAVLQPLGRVVGGAGEVGGFLVMMLAGTQARDGLCGRRLEVADRRRAHGRGRCGDLLLLMHRVRGAWVWQVDVRRRLRELALGFDEARLEVDDVVSQLVVFGLDGFVVFVQQVVVPHLLLELLDVSFFPLSERTLSKR